MANVAKKITNLRTPEQDFGQIETLEPWLRQKNEPADWYMRFKRYLDMSPKRSLRAVLASESGTQVNTKEGKKLSDVSVPRSWRRASKLWRWVERAAAYDLAQSAARATQIRNLVTSAPHASKAYRILQLDYAARFMQGWLAPGTKVEGDQVKDYLAIIARYQSIMQQIAREMEGLDETTMEMCDAAAMFAVRKGIIEQEYINKTRDVSSYQKIAAQKERDEALAKLKKQRT